jgi:hypothetical protein
MIGFDVAWRARGRTRVGGRENQRTSIPARASRNQLAHESARDEAGQRLSLIVDKQLMLSEFLQVNVTIFIHFEAYHVQAL